MKLLSRSEEIVLLAIWKLQQEAYGLKIRQQVINDTDVKWTIGAIYAPLHRLEKKGMVSTIEGDPVPERGGRRKIFYLITKEGRAALAKIQQVNESIWNDIPSFGLDEI